MYNQPQDLRGLALWKSITNFDDNLVAASYLIPWLTNHRLRPQWEIQSGFVVVTFSTGRVFSA